MASLELREEIRHGRGTYFLQTSFLSKKKQIQSSFFRNGVLFDTDVYDFDQVPPADQLRALTKDLHNRNKKRFRFLLDVSDKIKNLADPVAHLRLAQALLKRNLYDEAVNEAELAIEKGAEDSAPHLVIGEAWFRIGDYDSAFQAIQKGIAISPDYPDLHNLMGKIYLKQKDCRMAVDSFKRAIELNLYYGEPYLNLVRAYLMNSIIKQDYELSRDMDEKFNANIKRAVQLNPFLDTGAVDEARGFFREKKLEEALEIMERLSEVFPGTVVDDIILELYLLLLHSGENLPEEEIERYLTEVAAILDQNPTYADAYNSIGILYTAKCKILMDKAAEAFRKALDINGEYAKAQKNQRLTENDRQGIFILLKALLD